MTQSSARTMPAETTTTASRSSGLLRVAGRAGIEVALIGVLYVGYVISRTFASTAFAPARGRAFDILTFEKSWRIDVESWLNDLFFKHEWIGVASSFWYATTHYLVTLVVLVWLYRRSVSQYVTARRAIVLASVMGLIFYLLMPTAPPRLVGGYHDILSLNSGIGWWSQNGSAPKGMGDITNDLAAFPSLHAGWALWVAIVLIRAGVPRIVQGIGLAYAAMMTVVIIGTGNHWIVDAVVGWAVVLVAFGVMIAFDRDDCHGSDHDAEHEPESARA
ncbi:phosphatase PAP2 family protein [Aeromicrobium yanjiei]|uniref:Inositol phosphorylceramide synthase n=1 Tax=Aeromicrobium yanjiei TaxID=2662028 RepID=A0A5Q2MGF3_9ACTN|nr:phosphatase PAP2 family protein [Aeromicrobium yanjiei]QGG40122.1 inositol phosphorylceramide synthase [Aeromicrobium yanjiei]